LGKSIPPVTYFTSPKTWYGRVDMIKTIEGLLFRIGSNDLRVKMARKRGAKIGENCRIFDAKFGSEPYLISIGNHCEITSGVTFITHDGGTWVFRESKEFLGSKFGPIVIRDNCFIGINTIILPNVIIGPNSVVGAGSVVTKDIPANCVYAGNPARCICEIGDYLKKCKDNIGNLGTNDHRAATQKDLILERFKDQLK